MHRELLNLSSVILLTDKIKHKYMKLIKTLFILLTISSFVLSSCNKDDDSDAQAIVSVVTERGNPISDVRVKMYDEKTYETFKNDNRTAPNEFAITNSSGVAYFHLSNPQWFKGSSRQFTFVVQVGEGDENYQIWAVGKTFRPGETLRIEIKLTGVN